MSDANSHEAGEPHNGACANGADCGHSTIIDKTDLAALRARVEELQAAGERMVTPEVLQAVKDRLYGEIHKQKAAYDAEVSQLRSALERIGIYDEPGSCHRLCPVCRKFAAICDRETPNCLGSVARGGLWGKVTQKDAAQLAIAVLSDRNWKPGVHLGSQLDDRMTLAKVILGWRCDHNNDDGRGCATCAEIRARVPAAAA